MRFYKTSPNHGFGTKQNGAALILFSLLIFLVATSLFFGSFNSRQQSLNRDKVTAQALSEAKSALIGAALSNPRSPGGLPCPDSSGDGEADDCDSHIGRLPWRTLGVGDLRDAHGERLWYALSPQHNGQKPEAVINLATLGTLTVDGESDYVAIVFSSGPPLNGQSRPSDQVSDYLEGDNADGDDRYLSLSDVNANDRLLTIRRSELNDKLALRVLNEIKGTLTQGLIHYYEEKGVFPFADEIDLDGVADGIADEDVYEGRPSYEGLENESLAFDDDTKDLLVRNDWVNQVHYLVDEDRQAVTLRLGIHELMITR